MDGPPAQWSCTPVYPPVQSKTNDTAYQQKVAKIDCTDPRSLEGGKFIDPALWLGTCQNDGTVLYSLEPAAVQGTEITGATATLAQGGAGGWEVDLTFSSTGASQWATLTTQLYAKDAPQNQVAIVLDGLVISAPRVVGPILGGTTSITGNFSAQEAKDLAAALKFGALPVTLEVASIEQVSPTLGSDQLTAGLIAGGLGLAIVVLYLLLYYRALGMVAVVSLLVAAGITYGMFVVLGRQLGLALSLAGVAGAIVAIGITADSFIVYFERIRDEVRDGRNLRAAVDAGWARARRTILAADFVSFLAAVILYFVSVGNVRGFAFTLGLTTIIDVFVAFLFTHPLMMILARNRWFSSGAPMTGFDPHRLGVAALPGTPARKTPVAASSKES